MLPYDPHVCAWGVLCQVCGLQPCDACEHELRDTSSAAATKVCHSTSDMPGAPLRVESRDTPMRDPCMAPRCATPRLPVDLLTRCVVRSSSATSNGGIPAQPSGALERAATQSVVVENPPSLDEDGNEVTIAFWRSLITLQSTKHCASAFDAV